MGVERVTHSMTLDAHAIMAQMRCSRRTAYRILARSGRYDARTDAPSTATRGPKRVLAVLCPDAPVTGGV